MLKPKPRRDHLESKSKHRRDSTEPNVKHRKDNVETKLKHRRGHVEPKSKNAKDNIEGAIYELLKSDVMSQTKELEIPSDDAASYMSEKLFSRSPSSNDRSLELSDSPSSGSSSPPLRAKNKPPSDSSSDCSSEERRADLEDLEFQDQLNRFDFSDADLESLGLPKSSDITDGGRIWHDISLIARWCIDGKPLQTGDKSARAWFMREAKQLGCEVRVDEVGNVFAILPGEDMDVAPIGIGSNINTREVANGRPEEILGFVGSIEILRAIKANQYQTYAPIAAICWANDGTKSKPHCIGSSVWSCQVPFSEDLARTVHIDRTCLGTEHKKCECVGPWWADYRHSPLNAHFELHVGQCMWPEESNTPISIATALYGIRQFVVEITSTPKMQSEDSDSDSDDSSAESSDDSSNEGDQDENISDVLEQITDTVAAEIAKTDGFAMTTVLDEDDALKSSGSRSRKVIEIDLRHSSDSTLDDLEERLPELIALIAADHPRVSTLLRTVWKSPAAELNEVAGACLELAASELLGLQAATVVPSVEAHDGAFVSKQIPSAIMYVLCKNRPNEGGSVKELQKECNDGVQILLQSILRYDTLLKTHIGIVP